MEVATAVLYLEAAYDDNDPANVQPVQRSQRLAQRLDHVIHGGQPEPLDGWMEDLYRRVSDRQIMGSVVDELRTTLGEVEAALDTFFRQPADKTPLHEVPGRLAQMRGVFSVLGLDQAALAALRMRDSVEQCLVDDIDANSARGGVFGTSGNSLGSLGFLIDMLSYQRELAKKLFFYDEELGEFRSLMGRQKTSVSAEVVVSEPEVSLAETSSAVAEMAAAPVPGSVVASEPPSVVPPVVQVPVGPSADEEDDDAELRAIFLEEARDVVQAGLASVAVLQTNSSDFEQQASLRRSFHTSRAVPEWWD